MRCVQFFGPKGERQVISPAQALPSFKLVIVGKVGIIQKLQDKIGGTQNTVCLLYLVLIDADVVVVGSGYDMIGAIEVEYGVHINK